MIYYRSHRQPGQRAPIVEQGERDAVFDDPQHEYTRTLLAAVPRIRPEWERARREAAGARAEEGTTA
ncbi:hypothetical protein ACQFYA_00850 [Promicromonospora sp. Marseille-Q5078]